MEITPKEGQIIVVMDFKKKTTSAHFGPDLLEGDPFMQEQKVLHFSNAMLLIRTVQDFFTQFIRQLEIANSRRKEKDDV